MKPKVLLVGGPDIDRRIDLMQLLAPHFLPVAVGTDANCAAQFAQAGLGFVAYGMTRTASPVADVHSLAQLVRVFRRERPALVHAFDTKPMVWARLAARIAGVPVVVGTVTGLGLLYTSRLTRHRALRRVYQPLAQLACHLSDMTVFQNPDDQHQLLARGVAVARRSTVVAGSGVRTDLFLPNRDPALRREVRRELGLGDNEVVVLHVARVTASKGVREFAASARAMAAVAPHVRYVLVGAVDAGGGDALTAGELADLHGSVRWLGHRHDIARLLGAADIFAYPTAYGEGVPRALLEAAACGLPLVATDVAGCRQVVLPQQTGLLVPPRQVAPLTAALLTLAQDRSLRQKLGAAARAHAIALFDTKLVANQVIALYRRLLQAKQCMP